MEANHECLAAPMAPGDGSARRRRRGEGRAASTPSTPRPPAVLPNPHRVKPSDPAAKLIRTAFEAAIARIRAADPEARRGDVEGVHRLRTSTRRLRSELRTVEPLVDRRWKESLETDLKWLADTLGRVRDLDILGHRLREAAQELAPARPGGETSTVAGSTIEPLIEELRVRHRHNSEQLRQALRSDRYRRLIGRLETSVDRPELKKRAERPCREVLPPLAAKAWKRLRKAARKLERSSPDAEFHEVRKLAKRARYTAELIGPALGRSAKKSSQRFVRLTTRLQDILGEHQDAVVALSELERFLSGHAAEVATAREIRDLLEGQRLAADRARDAFFEIWPKLDRKKSLRWLKPRDGASA